MKEHIQSVSGMVLYTEQVRGKIVCAELRMANIEHLECGRNYSTFLTRII